MNENFFKTTIAYNNWKNKYQYKNETPLGTFQRIAKVLSSNEKNPEEWYDIFLNTLIKFDSEGNPIGIKCSPGGRITSNIGTDYKNATLMNCFINGPVQNAEIRYVRKNEYFENKIKIKTKDTPDDLINIFLTILEQAKTLASEGGYGLNFDFIRPRGSIIKGTGIRHPGVVSYMEVWNKVAECIVKGDNDGYLDALKDHTTKEERETFFGFVDKETRKGAMMGCLSIDHPDVEEFVRAKQESGKLTKFNMSVAVTDEFMKCYQEDKMWDLIWKDKVVKRVKAKDLYNLIMKSTYHRAEPGILFVDNMDKNNPISYLGKCNATNPSLHKDTMVLTNKGVFPIEHISGRINIKVLNFKKEWKACKIFKTGNKKQLYKITLSDNSAIYCTPEHKWPILKNRRCKDNYEERYIDYSSFDKIRTDSLKPKSKLYFPKIDNPFINNDCKFNRDDGFILGWNMGDGWKTWHKTNNVYQYGFITNNNENYIGDKIDNYINNITKSKSTFRPSNRNAKSKELITTDVNVRNLFEKFNYISKSDGIPSSVWEGNDAFVKGFIDGIFSSDGSIGVKEKKITFTSSKEKFIYDVQKLLSFYGIDSKVRKSITNDVSFPNGKIYNKQYERYDLVIRRRSIKRFQSLFILTHIEKNKNLKTISSFKYKYENIHYKTVKFVELSNVYEDVYDITVFDDTHTFMCVNGVMTGNCGEIPGNPVMSTVCLLGSINLTQYVDICDSVPCFNWRLYMDDIITFTRMLDNVCDLTELPLPSYAWAVKNLRQFGMGVNGLGSTLIMLGIKYNSPEGVEFARRIKELKENFTMQTSSSLADEKGQFPLFDYDELSKTEYYKSERLNNTVKNQIKTHGLRNAKTTTNPPLGNSSVICDNVSNGIEPVFDLESTRKVVCQFPEGMNSDNVKEILKEKKKKDFTYWEGKYEDKKYYYEPHNRGLCEMYTLRDYGYQWILDNFPEKKKADFLVTTSHLDIQDHLNIQEVVQFYCNQSVSKTINLPNKYSFEKFKELYVDAWKRGLIGVTTYRTGSMEAVMEKLETAEEKNEIIKKGVKLPETFINGVTKTIKRENMKFYIHFSYLPKDIENKYPIAMWINTNSKNDVRAANKACKSLGKLTVDCGIPLKIVEDTWDKCLGDSASNRLARMVSLCLRHNIPRQDILVALREIEGDNVSTLLTAVRKFIGETIDDNTHIVGMKCPECQSDSIVMQSGCFVCNDCGYSGCGA